MENLGGQVRQWFAKHDPDYLHAAALLIEFEGVRSTPYEDAVGIWTVGVGHRISPSGDNISANHVDHLGKPVDEWPLTAICLALQDDLRAARSIIPSDVLHVATAKQQQALVSLIFNVGSIHSTLLADRLEQYATGAGSLRSVVAEWVTYDKAGGHELRGLLLRRLAECRLWVQGA